jgi:hypothetical protein
MSNDSTTALFAQDFTGPRWLKDPDEGGAESSDWDRAYTELFRPVYHGTGTEFTSLVFYHSSPGSVRIVVDALPIAQPEMPSDFMASLHTIQRCLSSSASDVARMLQVSRQMIYHYREGMEPAVENFRRMKFIANIVHHSACDVSLEPIIKLPQPEGKSLLAFLSEDEPNSHLVQNIVRRANADLKGRRKLAELIAYATPHERRDVMRERHSQGKPIYVTDPATPGRVLQIRPDQSRVSGRMINRVFVPDEG